MIKRRQKQKLEVKQTPFAPRPPWTQSQPDSTKGGSKGKAKHKGKTKSKNKKGGKGKK